MAPHASPGGSDREAALTLVGFRVRAYRAIRDSGFVPVYPLTALVGREQSGKTSLLHALLGLDPEARDPYSLERDWPRGSGPPRPDARPVCVAGLRFGARARAELVGRGAVDDGTRGVRVSRAYGGELSIAAWGADPRDELLGDAAAPASDELASYARARLPRLLFAAHDALLPGAIPWPALAGHGEADGEDEESGTLALGQLLVDAGLRPDELASGVSVRRARQLGDLVRALLQDRGRPQALSLREERGRLLVSLESAGRPTPVDLLPREARYRLTLDLRLAALEGRRRRRGAVLLLDSPGRAFRREERPQMRELFDGWVRSGVTLVYTARLPFDVELQHPEQVLVLSPARAGHLVAPGAADHLALRAALGMSGRTSFRVDDLNVVVEGPSDERILRALDGLLRRSGEPGLPPGANLTSAQGSYGVAAVGAFLGRQGLGVIALLDSDQAGRTARDELDRALAEGGAEGTVEVLLLAEASGFEGEDAAIEGLFPARTFVDAVREVCGAEAGGWAARGLGADEPGTRNPAARLARLFEARGRRFPKGEVVEALAARVEGLDTVAALPPGMLGPVRRLMEALRSAAERRRAAGIVLSPPSGYDSSRRIR